MNNVYDRCCGSGGFFVQGERKGRRSRHGEMLFIDARKSDCKNLAGLGYEV